MMREFVVVVTRVVVVGRNRWCEGLPCDTVMD